MKPIVNKTAAPGFTRPPVLEDPVKQLESVRLSEQGTDFADFHRQQQRLQEFLRARRLGNA
ncbi:MAG: hypothetical protein AB1758_12095 [Candidatus Eremiobacterota bacterium]